MTNALQRPRYLLDAEALDDVADFHVFIIGEAHAAFLPHRHFVDVVLEALELRELALVDDDVVADETDLGAALDLAFGDAAAGDLAVLRNREDFENFCVAEECLAQLRIEHTRKRALDVIDEIVDHRIVTDLNASALGFIARLLVGADVKADDRRA